MTLRTTTTDGVRHGTFGHPSVMRVLRWQFSGWYCAWRFRRSWFCSWANAAIHSITEIIGCLAHMTRRTGIDRKRPSAVILRWASCKCSLVSLCRLANLTSAVVNLVFGISSFRLLAFIRWPLHRMCHESHLCCDCFQQYRRAFPVDSIA